MLVFTGDVNVYHHTEISVCGRYYFYVLPCVYQVIANGVKKYRVCLFDFKLLF